AVFGEEFNSFRDGFVRIMAQLEIQLDKEDIHECDSKKCLTQLKKKFENFFYRKSKEDFHESDEGRMQQYMEGSKSETMEEEVPDTFRLLHTLIEDFSKKDLTNACFSSGFHQAFSSLFGEDVEYFAPRLFFNMDKLEKQLNAEEFNEEIAMVVFKNILISLMDSIKKAIAERGSYKRVHDNRVHERMMQTHEGMISKDAPKIDNNVSSTSHDKDNMTEDFNEKQNIEKTEQEKNELQDQMLKAKSECLKIKNATEDKYVDKIIQLEAKNKDLENKICLGYTDPCPLGQAIACHPKLYDVEVLGLHYVKPDVYDTKEILNDAEENPSTSNVSSELSLDELDVPPKEIPNEGKLLKLFVNLENVIKKLVTFNLDFHMDKRKNVDKKGIQRLFSHEVVPISRSLNECSTIIQHEITEEVKEVLDIFESMESNVDRTTKKNDILQNKMNQLLETNIDNDVRNLAIQSYMEIKNKEEIERFSKESKDGDKFCNDVVEVKEKLSKQIGQLENNFAKLEAQSIAFEISLQHKTQENKSLKTLQKENENFMASLQIENAHLKQTYKDLFQFKVQELKPFNNAFADEEKMATTRKLTTFDEENCDFGSKVTDLEKIIAQKIKDFDDVKLELSNITAKFEAYFEKLKNTKVVLEQQLARKVDDSKAEKDQFFKEINHLSAQLENLRGKSVETKFDKPSILEKPPVDKLLINSQISKSWFTPKVVV
ncbi:hypothetical protein Tco_0424272, partial [Tanacetum coccineum]